jgi:hypothetical protein
LCCLQRKGYPARLLNLFYLQQAASAGLLQTEGAALAADHKACLVAWFHCCYGIFAPWSNSLLPWSRACPDPALCRCSDSDVERAGVYHAPLLGDESKWRV